MSCVAELGVAIMALCNESVRDQLMDFGARIVLEQRDSVEPADTLQRNISSHILLVLRARVYGSLS